ncbi:MAG: hypothetical protein EKK41_08030 [Hyphomicrobiales bacterium]|nr:MAG: hypothetical protein EKK41_08030 [Hyphomicrobiales bacterium]
MKLDEFKAWFEGFTESMERAPTAKQWKRIKERVAEIDGAPVTERIYLDRYWPVVQPLYQPWYVNSPHWRRASASTTQYQNGLSSSLQGQFDGVSAMYAAGQAEALED